MGDNLTYDMLKSMMSTLPTDPLLERGIGKDWLAVVNPCHVRDLLDATEPFPQEHHRMGDAQRLEVRIGRQLYILSVAPTGGIEYLDPISFYAKYGKYLARMNRITREAQEQESGDNSESE
jgi:hypothetical protein